MASAAVRDPAPRVTLVRSRTVANVDSIGLGRAQVHPVLGRIVVERQQHLLLVDDLRDGPREFRRVLLGEGLIRGEPGFAVIV